MDLYFNKQNKVMGFYMPEADPLEYGIIEFGHIIHIDNRDEIREIMYDANRTEHIDVDLENFKGEKELCEIEDTTGYKGILTIIYNGLEEDVKYKIKNAHKISIRKSNSWKEE